MIVNNDGSILVPMSTARALKEESSVLARTTDKTMRESLEAERAEYERALDGETIARWELLHSRYQEYRQGAPRLAEQMRKLAPEYCKAVCTGSAGDTTRHSDRPCWRSGIPVPRR